VKEKADMATDIYGWCGKILRVDLSDSSVTELDTMAYADRFLGGRGIATKIYWDEVDPDVDAFDPENLFILMNGPLTATGAQGASRFQVVGKSPMTYPERFCYGNLGGFFSAELKRAGYDGVVVHGRSEAPVYIWINDGKAEICDATDLWGRGTYAVRDILQDKHGRRTRFVATGPAGENLCRGATVNTDHEGSATGGFGAVMGSKNLKAIAVQGPQRPAVADPDRLKSLNKYTIELSQRGTLRMPIPRQMMEYVKTASCYQCGLDCIRGLYKTMSGKEAVRKCQALTFYIPYATMRQDGHIDESIDATALCNDYSMCTMEFGNIIGWLQAAYRNGLLTDRDTGLDMSRLGTRQFVEQLLSIIVNRQGFGDALAEGLPRAGEKLGNQATSLFGENIGDVGMGGGYTPREYITTALLWALAPRQPISELHEVSYPIARWLFHLIRPEKSPTTAAVFRAQAERFWGGGESWNLTTYGDKARAAMIIQDRTVVRDSLILCEAAYPIMDSFNTPDQVGDPTLENQLFSAATGVETDEAELYRYGKRIYNLQRGILLREGWRPKIDDYPPEYNFTVPVENSSLNPKMIVPGLTEDAPFSFRGNLLDRGKYETMRDEYYALRGWDPETGLQTGAALGALDMSDVASQLMKINLLK